MIEDIWIDFNGNFLCHQHADTLGLGIDDFWQAFLPKLMDENNDLKISKNPKTPSRTPKIPLRYHRHYLKPWKDPESLFCDTEFLEEKMMLSLRKGKECKDENQKAHP